VAIDAGEKLSELFDHGVVQANDQTYVVRGGVSGRGNLGGLPTLGTLSAPTRGDVIRGSALSQWQNLPLGASGYHLQSDGSDVVWAGFIQVGTGAQARSWQSKVREIEVNVADFSVTPLANNTDITAVVQAAVASIPTGFSSPHTLVFPDGQFFISSEIGLSTRGRITLKCHGFGTCILILANGSNSNMFKSGDGTTYTPNVAFQNLYLDGNRANQASGDAIISFDAVEFPTLLNCYLTQGYGSNVKFDGTGSGISSFPTVLGSVLQSPGLHNVHLGPNGFGARICENSIRGAGQRVVTGSAGVFAENNSEIGIFGNNLDENVIHVRLASAERASVCGNQMLNCVQDGVKQETDCKWNTISGNVINEVGTGANNTYHGVVLTGSYTTVSGNSISGVSGGNIMAVGILESGSADNNVIANNSIENSTTKTTVIGASTVAIANGDATSQLLTTLTVGPHRFDVVANDVNGIELNAAATTGSPFIQARGADTNIGINFNNKGNANFGFFTASFARSMFFILDNASGVNWTQVRVTATGVAPSFEVAGSDTNIDLALVPKGTGVLRAGTAGMFAANGAVNKTLGNIGPTGSQTTVQEWFMVKNSAGTVRYIPAF
jgi:hypothetical protein